MASNITHPPFYPPTAVDTSMMIRSRESRNRGTTPMYETKRESLTTNDLI